MRLDCYFVSFSPPLTLIERHSTSPWWRCERGKHFVLSKRSVLSAARIRLRSPAALGAVCKTGLAPSAGPSTGVTNGLRATRDMVIGIALFPNRGRPDMLVNGAKRSSR